MSRPYDAEDISPEQTELATSLRIPFVTTFNPRWCYVTAVVVSSESWCGGLVPTEDEVRAIASFDESYRERWYNEWFKGVMRERAPYDLDCGAVGRYLIKYPETGGWAYRRSTWRSGPPFWPQRYNAEPVSLLAALDHCEGFAGEPNPQWENWKAEHADVFALVAAGVT